MPEALLIVNPMAGGAADPGLGDRLASLLAAEGMPAVPRVTFSPGEARAAAQEAAAEGRELVVVAGGDGTIGEVVGPLAGTGIALGLIPLGTANGAALELGLPINDPAAACHVLATGRAFEADLGVANDQAFLLMCGVGLDALVAQRVDALWKRALGKWAFIGQFLQTVFDEPMRPFTVTVDDVSVETEMWATVVCNSAQYTWRLSFAPAARLDDGLLHVVMFHQPDAVQLLNAVGAEFLGGGAERIPHTTIAQGRTVRVATDPPLPWQTDGDPRGTTPVEVAVRPRCLRLIVPPGYAGPVR
jgi:diacylglycerol kinase (ATP)